MVLGPSSSRLLMASSLFVKQVEVRDHNDKKGVSLYGFSERPELNVEAKWNSSKFVIVGSYSRKRFPLWLNKGSRITIKCEAQSSILSQLEVSLIKGERNHESMLSTNFARFDVSNGTTYGVEAAYRIDEDDRYNIGIVNPNFKGVIVLMNVSISSTMYNIKKSKSMCSTKNGPCRLNMSYPSTQYIVLTTPNTQDLSAMYVEISFIARLVAYLGVLGVSAIIICSILKLLGACHDESHAEQTPVATEITEIDHMVPQKELGSTYGTYEPYSGRSSSSEDLYDGKICVICYDNSRNCFFVPCGHCATCEECAQRIVDVESRVCPVCRRPIHKVKKLIIP